MTTAAQRLAWLCDELAAGNAFSPDQLRKWADEARAEHAAAPDMLAALKGLVNGPIASWRDDGDDPALQEAIRVADAAIAKAEGRS